jgi:hypothetical protein
MSLSQTDTARQILHAVPRSDAKLTRSFQNVSECANMAEPPNALTLLLFPERTASRMYDALVAKRCLTGAALSDRSRVIAIMDATITDFESRETAAGGTLWYEVIGALLEKRFLNEHARARLNADRSSPSFTARLRAFLQEPWWRLRY